MSDSSANQLTSERFSFYLRILICLLLLLALLAALNLSYILQTLASLFPIAVRVYLLSLIADLLHSFINRDRAIHLLASCASATLPVLLIFPFYALVSSLFVLPVEQLQFVLSIGLAITYFNLGAALSSGSLPLDLGIVLSDGRRLLGEGKTVRGTVGGLVMSVLTSATVSGLMPGLVVAPLAMLGDALGSFVKRRIGLDRGGQLVFLDQLDCVLPFLVLQAGWHVFDMDGAQLAVLILSTLLIQVYGNVCLFYLGKKQVPW